MSLSTEQIRLLIKHEWLLGSNGLTATQRINKAWGDGTVTKSTAYRWIEKFEAGQEDFADDPRSGRPRDVNCHAIIETIQENPSMTTRMLAEDFGCSHVWVAEILKEAGKSHFLHPYSHFSLGKTWKKSESSQSMAFTWSGFNIDTKERLSSREEVAMRLLGPPTCDSLGAVEKGSDCRRRTVL